jgi:glycosyltransferase involved in cell wall biosynthesis
MDLSVVIPLYNESESIEELNTWVTNTLNNRSISFEIIYVNDGSSDGSWDIIKRLADDSNNIKGISFSKNFGKSQALNSGFTECKGKYVATLDADLQDSPEEIPEMINKLKEKDLDLISGWKKKRYDSLILKKIPSKLFNFVARCSSGIKIHDFNCGIKVFKSEVIKSIDVYGDMHRFIPILAKNEGYNKIGEHIVKHQARKYGKTKFGNERFMRGFLDIITLWFMNKFGKRPMHFFGSLGTIMILIGIIFTGYIGYEKLFIKTSGRLITERPEFYIALTTIIIGIQLFIAGFIGEIVLNSKSKKERYQITEKTVD